MEKITKLKAATSFIHNGTIGDVIASLPAMREHYRKNKDKLTLYLLNGQEADYYAGATHPTRGKDGIMVMLNEAMIKMLIPLLAAQPCFKEVKMYEGEPVQCDLNQIRKVNVGMPNFCISRWYFYAFPDMACDLSEIWLTIPDNDKDLAKGKIIISRTERYLNPNIDYSFLEPYQDDILFSGTELEYVIFIHRFNLKNIKRLIVNDFLELAQAIKQCKFHISNQTMAFQISQGLKIPRIVELCAFAPNVLVVGKNAYDFFAQEGLEYYFHTLNGTLQGYMKMYEENKIAEIAARQKPDESGIVKIPFLKQD